MTKLAFALGFATYAVREKVPRFLQIADVCYGETTPLFCYTAPQNTPQNVAVADITFAAAYLRAYGRELKAGRFLTMLTTDGTDCPEWSLYTRGSVLITAKHVNPAINSSILFEDIAATIDGGSAATAAQQAAALYGCGTTGGSKGAAANMTAPAYNTTAYRASGYSPSGIVIKVVASGA